MKVRVKHSRSLTFWQAAFASLDGICPSSTVPAALYLTNPFIQSSQRADLAYMQDLLDRSGSTAGGGDTLKGGTAEETKISAEINASLPKDNHECSSLVGNDCSDIFALPTGTADEIVETKDRKIGAVRCHDSNKRYWDKHHTDWSDAEKCQDTGVLAMADYTRWDGKMYFKDGSSINPTNFAQPTSAGQYISYDPTKMIGSLAGKTITFELANAVGGIWNRALFSFGGNVAMFMNNSWNWQCYWRTPLTCHDKVSYPSDWDYYTEDGGKTITVHLPMIPLASSANYTKFVLGSIPSSATPPAYNYPLNNQIRSIKIK